MTTEEIKRILAYCRQATEGPWGRDVTQPKVICSNADKPKNICQLTGQTHKEDWNNYHFIANARTDLPQLAEYCLELIDLVRQNRRRVEEERGQKQRLLLEKANRQLALRKERRRLEEKRAQRQQAMEAAREQSERDKHERLVEAERQNAELQRENINRQVELEQSREQLDVTNKSMQQHGYCDDLLNELDAIQASLETSVEPDYQRTARSAEPVDDSALLGGQKRIRQPGVIENTLPRSMRRGRQEQAISGSDLAAEANEFATPLDEQSQADAEANELAAAEND